ncbi:MAG TPA: IclR family transcriptional regulator [Anaerolineales bacterium]|jgi:DNA-binding IclR family transcriptional regulator
MDESPEINSYLVGSLDRGLAGLLQFTHQPEMTFSQFMQASDLNKASAKRTLYTLEKNGFIRYNPNRKTYFLGVRLFELGTVAADNFALLKIAKPYMETICAQINETVIVSQKVDDEQIYLHKIEGVGTVHLKTLIGYRRPLYYGLGRAILAYLCEDDINNCLPEHLPAYEMNTITEREKFMLEVQVTRERGYAIDNEEFIEGVTGIGFPVFINEDQVFGLIGVVAPTQRFTCEKKDIVVNLLRKASSAVSAKLHGYIYNTI